MSGGPDAASRTRSRPQHMKGDIVPIVLQRRVWGTVHESRG